MIKPHAHFETIEEVFDYTDQVMQNFRDSGVWRNTPREALEAIFSMNHAYDELSRICAIHFRRVAFHNERGR